MANWAGRGEQIHLAVFDDGTWETRSRNVNEYRQEHNIPEPEQRPQYDDDELLADFADYLGAAPNPEFDARSYADAEHRKLSIILDALRAELYDAEQDPDQIAKAVGLRGRISLTKQRLDRLWYWAHKATDSRAATSAERKRYVRMSKVFHVLQVRFGRMDEPGKESFDWPMST